MGAFSAGDRRDYRRTDIRTPPWRRFRCCGPATRHRCARTPAARPHGDPADRFSAERNVVRVTVHEADVRRSIATIATSPVSSRPSCAPARQCRTVAPAKCPPARTRRMSSEILVAFARPRRDGRMGPGDNGGHPHADRPVHCRTSRSSRRPRHSNADARPRLPSGRRATGRSRWLRGSRTARNPRSRSHGPRGPRARAGRSQNPVAADAGNAEIVTPDQPVAFRQFFASEPRLALPVHILPLVFTDRARCGGWAVSGNWAPHCSQVHSAMALLRFEA